MTRPGLPPVARWLLRLTPVSPDRRAEVEGDLHELFESRCEERGAAHARWRLCCDIASLCVRGGGPRVQSGESAPPFALLRDAGADTRYAARLFARQPGILLLTIAGLSLGLGIATAAFSIMNAAALRGDGLVDSDRAPGILRATDRSTATVWDYDEFQRLRDGSTRMQVEAVLTDAARVRIDEPADAEAPSAGVAFVSGGFFAATGGAVIAGRALETADEGHTGPPPVVVSFLFWATRLDSEPAVVGKTIRVGRTDATIVGVAERGFALPHSRSLWMPLTAHGQVYGAAQGKRAPDMGVELFGRLLPGVEQPEAEAQLSGVAAALPVKTQPGDSKLRVRLDPHVGLGRVSARQTLAISLFVTIAIGLVLLLACANVATVLVSSAITREREMGVRAALGASRARIVRQLVAESLALAAVAAAVAVLVTHWALPLIGVMIEAPAGSDFSPDRNVYLFVVLVTLVTGVGAGLAPAWHGRGVDLLSPLKGDGARQHRVAPRRLRSMLVMTQAAVSVLLIIMATLFMRASFNAATIDVGFDADGLYAVAPGLGRSAYDDQAAGIRSFWAQAVPAVAAVPGVASVSLAELVPFGDGTKTSMRGQGPERMIVHFNRTRADYFETVGLRFLAGRTYTTDEVRSTAPVAIISESVARTYWQDRSPLGEPLPMAAPGSGSSVRPVVVGVVADAITARLHERSGAAVYEPLGPGSERFAELIVRVAPGAAGAIDDARQRLRALDAQADVRVMSVAERLDQEVSRPRMLALLSGIVGLIAIVLCVIGLYGLTASVVGQRTREMSVRIAMGAERSDLLRLLLWDSLKPVAIGLAIGGGAALLASGVIAGLLFGVSPRDPVAFGGAVVILLGSATLAVLVPTRRAAAVDPALALRQS